MHKIIFLDKAIKNLQEISLYIAIDNPLYAKKVLDSIQMSIDYLAVFPYLWKERKDWLREIVSKYKYRVFYRVENEMIIVVSIFKYQDLY